MPKRSDQFQTIRTEGALLPPDILQSIASLKVEGVSPKSYHLPPGVKLNEAIAQSWSVLQKHWKGFQEARLQLDPDKPGTEITNQNWLLPLFEELKYGRLTTVKSPEIDGRTYPIERFYASQPIHLIGCNLPLDRRTTGARGAATASPHSMMQEYLNRSENGVWGFLSNGRVLRVLRDNVSLSRQAYVEFNLESMMEGEVYADFALLWMLCHQSRVEAEKPQDCWLEKWSQLARDLGTRVLSDLRNGVAKAIEALGRGFLSHPRNDRLREKLHSGQLSTQDFYRQLLRVVYRLLFLFVAEDRELLHPPGADEKACKLYDVFYSTRRLRELADRLRGSKHADLWQALSLVFDALGRPAGCAELGLFPLGSFLWQRSSTADLLAPAPKGSEPVAEPSLVANDDLLAAIRALAYVEQDKVRRGVDYRNLGSEELGSVYESLLELHPIVNVPARTFELSLAAGNERKTTGSYYTPDSLVQCLLDSALDPVVEDRLQGKKGAEAEAALLDIKVCDPACGSGHFLIAAAHRLARHLARVRTGESEPSPTEYQHALRDAIGRCIYGVDINPMAVELCKVSLWMEAIDPGKPLSFLEHHIQCGNSLLGTTPTLLAKGIPNDAFDPIEGDNKAICGELKRDNKKQRKEYETGQGYLFAPLIKLDNLPAAFSQLNLAADDSLQDVEAKRRMFERAVNEADYLNARLLADTWCAAFVWKKDNTDLGKHCPTERDFRAMENNPRSILPHVAAEVRRLAGLYQFFHWHLAFPDVFRLPTREQRTGNEQTGWNSGFDVVLGNPPWERLKLQEQEWFAQKAPLISLAANAAKRKKLIAQLEENEPQLFVDFCEAQRFAEGEALMLRSTGRFPFCGVGRDINSASVFTETMRMTVGGKGRVGCVVPSAIATDNTTKLFFRDLIETRSLDQLRDFENRNGIFPGVHRSYKFCLLTILGSQCEPAEGATLQFFALSPSDLNDPRMMFRLSSADIALINPNTMTCPVFRSQTDAVLTKHVYRHIPVLVQEQPKHSDWTIKTRPGLFHMSNHAHLFLTETNGDDNVCRMYEAKMLHQFDHRWAGYEDRDVVDIPSSKKLNPDYFITPQYWVEVSEVAPRLPDTPKWVLVVRDICRNTDERTTIASTIPATAVGGTLMIVESEAIDPRLFGLLISNLNSFAFDYVSRQKVAGTHLNPSIFKQLPAITPSSLKTSGTWSAESVADWLTPRVLELTYTASDLDAFALDFGYDGPPFRWDEERRFLLRCELDAAYFHLYLGTPEAWGADSPQLREMLPTQRGAVEYIMETFPIVKRKDIARTEVKNDAGQVVRAGHYVTKDTILEIYDEMAEAIRTGRPYKTRLDPPPGPPADAAGNFIAMVKWDKANWPSHIHPPREAAAR